MSAVGDIDVTIPGSEESVDAAARWLEGLRDNLYEASFSLDHIALADGLSGELASAMADYASLLKDANDDAYNRAKKAADVIRSFADELSWRKSDMKEHLETARGDDLEVKGNIIKYPTEVHPPGQFPRMATQDARNDWYARDEAYDNYLAKIRDFEKVHGRVTATFNQLNDWIVNNLVQAKQDALLAPFAGGIKGFIENAVGTGEKVDNHFKDTADALREAANAWAVDRATEKSGNPSVKTRSRPPSQSAIDNKLNKPKPTAWQKAADSFEGAGEAAGKVGKYVGGALAVGAPLYDLATGTPIGKVAVTVVAGVATVALLPEAAGVGGAIAVAAAAAVVAEGAGWAYENMVPLQYREKIEQPWEETKQTVGNGVDTAKNWAADTAANVKDKASDTWNQVTAWSYDYFGV